jgi:hypothetical protein
MGHDPALAGAGPCCASHGFASKVITPPQSGGLDGCEQPSGLPESLVTWFECTWLICPLGVKLLLMLDRGTHLHCLTTDG